MVRKSVGCGLALAAVLMGAGCLRAQLVVPDQSEPPVALPSGLPVLPEAEQARMDRDLMEIDIPRLQDLYRRHVYTVEQVTRWYLGRIAKYNGIYRDVQTVDVKGALETARREDAGGGEHGAMWGVPIVIKANTAVKGLIDTDGWAGFVIPGHEFVARARCDGGGEVACCWRGDFGDHEYAGFCDCGYYAVDGVWADGECL